MSYNLNLSQPATPSPQGEGWGEVEFGKWHIIYFLLLSSYQQLLWKRASQKFILFSFLFQLERFFGLQALYMPAQCKTK
jgi:hypothetical protein